MLSSISWISVHGWDDDELVSEEKYEKALHGKLAITCGQISLWASEILDKAGVRSRLVTSLTLEEWNSYDNGHTMLEVYIDELGKWVLYDLDNNVKFSIDSKDLNLCELCDAISAGLEYQLVTLACDAPYVQSDYSLYSEKILSGERNLRKWYNKVLQVPLISDNDKYYFYDSANRERIESYTTNYLYMDKSEFLDYFY